MLRVFEKRILRRVFGPKNNEKGEWRGLHNEKVSSLYRSPNIVRVINSRRLRWAVHVIRMEEGRSNFLTLFLNCSWIVSRIVINFLLYLKYLYYL